MINLKQVLDMVSELSDSEPEHPFGKDIAVYKVDDKIFALVYIKTNPVKISLKCEPQLAEILREKYETVMPGQNLNRKHWNTILLTGQLDWEEVQGLIRHSYNLATETVI